MNRAHVTGNSTAPHSVRGNDLYETPDVAVQALLDVEPIPPLIWEPACGRGAIARVLRDAGHSVYASDLVDYGDIGQPYESNVDFLKLVKAKGNWDAIVTNPPYKLAQAFVEEAIPIVPKVVMLLRLAFLESERRRGILDSGQLARVYVFRNRLPMMHRDGWDGPKASSSMAFAWFVWERDYNGPTILERISWEKPQKTP